MTQIAADLTEVRDAVARLAFARVDMTGTPSAGFLPLLDSVDAMIERWEGGASSADDYYRLGLLVGSLGYMAALRVNEDGVLEPMSMEYPDNPVAQAALGLRTAVLGVRDPA